MKAVSGKENGRKMAVNFTVSSGPEKIHIAYFSISDLIWLFS